MMNTFEIVNIIQTTCPKAYASIKGNGIEGTFLAYPYCNGSIVVVEATGLPVVNNQVGINALHIHEGSSCTGDQSDPFKDTLGHFSKSLMLHPYHSGDLPPLFSNSGYAWMSVYTNRFKVEDIINRTIVIHSSFDDFKTQPNGNSGKKIACGKILELFQ